MEQRWCRQGGYIAIRPTLDEDGRSRGDREIASVPLAVAVFAVQGIALRRAEERVNNVVRWTGFHRGGHFAAMEAPDLFLTDLRAFFTDYR